MKKTYGQHITDLLKEHQCVVLPELGAVLLKTVPAHISNGQIHPANKQIKFNKNILTDDELLVSKLVNNEDFTFLEAKKEVAKFVSSIKFELAQKGFNDVESLGRFTLYDAKSLKFIANNSILDLDKENFGFKNLSLYKIHREIVKEPVPIAVVEETKVVELKPEIVQENQTIVRKLRKPVLGALVATLLLMFGIFSLIVSNPNIDSLKVQNANVLNFLVSPKAEFDSRKGILKEVETFTNFKEEKNTKKNKITTNKKGIKKSLIIAGTKTSSEVKKVEETIIVDKNLNNPLIKNVLKVTNEDNPKGYYVVIGAFGSLENANKAKYKCSIDNTCKVFATNSGMYRVAIFVTSNSSTAIEKTLALKKSNNSYWLLENI